MAPVPAWLRTRKRQGRRLVNRPRDGAGQAIGGAVADLGLVTKSWGLRSRAGRGGENRVAVHRRMRGPQRACHAVMRHDGQTLGLRFGQGRVSGDDGDGGIFRGIALDVKAERLGGPWRGPAEAAELAIFFIRGGPEMRAFADGRAANRIHRDKRANPETGGGDIARRAETALEISVVAPKPAPTLPRAKSAAAEAAA